MNEVAPPPRRVAKRHGEVMPIEPEQIDPPALPHVLKGCLFLNLPHEEAVERYGLWAVKILQRCKVHGQTLEPGDEAELSGDVVQQFVLNGRAVVTDKRAKEEAEVINRATALGLPQKIREIVAFAPRKRDSFVRPKEEN